MKTNPFEIKKKNLPNGFYFDKKLKLLSFIFKDVSSETQSIKTYNRLHQDNLDMPDHVLELTGKNKNRTNVEDCVPLNHREYSKEAKEGDIIKDFKWICESEEVKKSFINFLEEHENYGFLRFFDAVVKSKIEK